MLIVGIVLVSLAVVALVRARRHRTAVGLLAIVVSAAVLVTTGGGASAAIVATVPLGTTAPYAVLAGSTVTNTGPSVIDGSVGLAPGTSVTGFPPGLVTPPGTIDAATATAIGAQDDLTTAYVNAAGRSVDATVAADLGGLTLQGGVYTGPGPALSLTGPLVLDGAGNFDSVFIFQAGSTLTTASGSSVSLINGAQACNVFWQVGSSATLGTGSTFVGNILALTSITVTTGVTIEGRALARNGQVSLDTDVFLRPGCAQAPPPVTTTPTTTPVVPTTATPGGTTPAVLPGPGSASSPPGDDAVPTPGDSTVATVPATPLTPTPRTPTPGTPTSTPDDSTTRTARPGTPRIYAPAGPGVPGLGGPPRTGADPGADPGTGPDSPWPTILLVLVGSLAIAGAIQDQRARSARRLSATH